MVIRTEVRYSGLLFSKRNDSSESFLNLIKIFLESFDCLDDRKKR